MADQSYTIRDGGRERYFGYPEHNLNATELLNFVFNRKQTELEAKVRTLALRNDYELPAYLQDGVLHRPQIKDGSRYIVVNEYPDKMPYLYMTALEAAVHMRNVPALELFESHIKFLLSRQTVDSTYDSFLNNALKVISGSIADFINNVKPILIVFVNALIDAIRKNNEVLMQRYFEKVGICLRAFDNEFSHCARFSVKGKMQLYWMAIPYILDGAKLIRNTIEKEVFKELQDFSIVAAYAYLATKISAGQRPSNQLNAISIGSEWEHYTHDPSSGVVFSEDGREISGEIGQRYHDLRFDAHTGQLLNQDGEEVELVGFGIPKIFKKAGSKAADLGKAGFARAKKAVSGPEVMFVLLLNETDSKSEVSVGGGLGYATTVKFKVRPTGKYKGTFEVKGDRSGWVGRRGVKTIGYPAIIVVPRNNLGKYHVAAYTNHETNKIALTKSSYSTDPRVFNFFTRMNKLSVIADDETRKAKIEEIFNEEFKDRVRTVNEQISSVFGKTHASSSSSSSSSSSFLEQF